MSLLQRLKPSIVKTRPAERLRAALGALVGIAATGLVSTLAFGGDHPALPLLVAPMGASAVLLFAAPTSPLAQPWSILGGNVIAALVGVTCAHLLPDPLIAASLAVALSIGAMLMANCLHPPGGAVALTAVLGGPAVHEAGYWFVLTPVGVNSLFLLFIALAFNNLTGHRYPHLARKPGNRLHDTADPLPTERLRAGLSDVAAAIRDYDEVLPVSPEEIEALMREAEARAAGRRGTHPVAADIMSRDVVAIGDRADLKSALKILAERRLDAAPVIRAGGRLGGVVRLRDFAAHEALHGGWRRHLTVSGRRNRPKTVADILAGPVLTVRPETPIAALVVPMSDGGTHLAAVTDGEGRLLGVVTQSDLLAALAGAPKAVTAAPVSAAS